MRLHRRLGASMDDCVFCGIVSGRLPVSAVYRDTRCLAFMDIHPINPGHILVVPTRHASGLAELDRADGAAIMQVASRIAVALRAGALSDLNVRCEGVSLFLSDGAAAGQVVGHVHLHVVPRYRGDGAGFRRGCHAGHGQDRDNLSLFAGVLARVLGQEEPASEERE